MKMTRLEWRYLQKIALDHPYYDTHGLPLTEQEAKAIVEANNKLTGREFVDSVYAKLGIPRPAEQKKRFAWLRSIGELFAVPPIRRIAIAVLIVILMAVFFAATPAGRAIAENVIRYIATLFDDGRLVVNRTDNEAMAYSVALENNDADKATNSIKNTTDYIYVNSFDEFTTQTGKTPVMLSLPFTELYYTCDKEFDYLTFYATYETPDGEIVTYQIWNVEDLVSTTSAGYTAYSADESIYYSIEKEEGIVSCKRVLEDSIFTVSSRGNYTVNDLIQMLTEN